MHSAAWKRCIFLTKLIGKALSAQWVPGCGVRGFSVRVYEEVSHYAFAIFLASLLHIRRPGFADVAHVDGVGYRCGTSQCRFY